MKKYLITRLFQNLLTFILFLTLVFFLMDLQPGDYGNLFLNDPRLTPKMRQALRAGLGLDKPVLERYLIWLKNVFKGDFGISFSNYPRRVIDIIKERAPRTIFLFLSATLVSYFIGFVSGKIIAWRRGSFIEYAATLVGVALYTVFLPWFALMMLWLFAFKLKLFPLGKFIDPLLWRTAPIEATHVFNGLLISVIIFTLLIIIWHLLLMKVGYKKRKSLFNKGIVVIFLGFVSLWAISGVIRYALDILWHLVLPVVTLGLISFASVMLLTRNSMLETIREDYITTARAKGLPEKVIRDKHAARNALLPVVTSFILALAFVMDGGIITESIFSWPGMGQTLLHAALVEDIPMVIGSLIFSGTLALTGHLLADILYAFLDPRVRYS